MKRYPRSLSSELHRESFQIAEDTEREFPIYFCDKQRLPTRAYEVQGFPFLLSYNSKTADTVTSGTDFSWHKFKL